MGLDMYLGKMPKLKGYSFEELIEISHLISRDLEKFKENSKHYEKLKPYIKECRTTHTLV